MTDEEIEIQKLNALCSEYRKQIHELEDKVESLKQDSHYWFGQANRNYEDCHDEWTNKIRTDTAKEIFNVLEKQEQQGRAVLPKGFLFMGRKAYGVEVDDE